MNDIMSVSSADAMPLSSASVMFFRFWNRDRGIEARYGV